jgi:spore maturation protein CgeB
VRIVMFYHSLVSDWNHGNAHFLRGIASELIARGHTLTVYEPAGAWSLQNLLRERGVSAITAFHDAYPELTSRFYDPDDFDLDRALHDAQLVLVHEWNERELIGRIGEHHARYRSYQLLFHDTHHRAVSVPHELARFDLRHYDGVLAFGEVLREQYLAEGWSQRAWTWHEAADTRVFYPRPVVGEPGEREDLVWIGNWGDDERSEQLTEFLLDPIAKLRLAAKIYGVRYPQEALERIEQSGAMYCGFLSNFDAPMVFARHKLTVHVPRRYYATSLPGIPTIRVFEALACGIPLVCAPWRDSEGLFCPGEDYLVARDGTEMTKHIHTLLHEPERARALAEHGLATIRARHTCAHRVDELLNIYQSLVSN